MLPIDIVIPFYRNSHLVQSVFCSIRRCAAELQALDCRIIAIDDSPEDDELGRALARAAAESPIPVELVRNSRNLGFVKSANRGMELSIASGHDVLLLNSDTLLFPGAITEMAVVAYRDEMIGFVSPRSNNATICTLPAQERFHALPPEEAHAAFLAAARVLPEYRYVPTAVGFCLFIKVAVLAEFGTFDEIYGNGYNEENDLIMRANRCGFRAALANHAYVYHSGGVSFVSSDSPAHEQERRNSRVLASRYPEYPVSVNSYFRSAQYEAELLLAALVPNRDGRLNLVFDFSNVGPYHCGTFEVARRILAEAVGQWSDRFCIHALASREAQRFHHLELIPGIILVSPDTDRTFAVAFRVGAPFDHTSLIRMSRLGVVNLYVMQDPIAYDCLYLNTPDLRNLWGFVMSHADGVVYISDFVRSGFQARFSRRPGLKEVVAHHSLEPDEYAPVEKPTHAPGGHILVLGNDFAHKWTAPTVTALAKAFPEEQFVVLGPSESVAGARVKAYTSGRLREDEMDQLYRDARLVIYPSMYEGFGLPVMRALANRKPVCARAIPAARELCRHLADARNVHLYHSTRELVELLRCAPVWQEPDAVPGRARYGWAESVRDMGKLVDEALQDHSVRDVLLPRLEALRRWGLASPGSASSPGSNSELIRDLQLQVERGIKEVTDLRASWSWRITAPLRSALDAYHDLLSWRTRS